MFERLADLAAEHAQLERIWPIRACTLTRTGPGR